MGFTLKFVVLAWWSQHATVNGTRIAQVFVTNHMTKTTQVSCPWNLTSSCRRLGMILASFGDLAVLRVCIEIFTPEGGMRGPMLLAMSDSVHDSSLSKQQSSHCQSIMKLPRMQRCCKQAMTSEVVEQQQGLERTSCAAAQRLDGGLSKRSTAHGLMKIMNPRTWILIMSCRKWLYEGTVD